MSLIIDKQPVIFCDYDGTATEYDVIEMVLKAFALPGWKSIVKQILEERTLSLKEGIIELFRLIPGSKREEINQFVLQNVKLREGFEDFLTFCQTQQISVLVVSGGIDFLIYPILEPYLEKLSIYCNKASFYEDRIELHMPYFNENCQTCGGCACCKVSIMDKYPASDYYRIVIGDSLTDLAAAKHANKVFARSRLIDYAKQDNIAITPFKTFTDIQEALSKELMTVSYA